MTTWKRLAVSFRIVNEGWNIGVRASEIDRFSWAGASPVVLEYRIDKKARAQGCADEQKDPGHAGIGEAPEAFREEN